LVQIVNKTLKVHIFRSTLQQITSFKQAPTHKGILENILCDGENPKCALYSW